MVASIADAPKSHRPEGMGFANVRTESTFEQIPVMYVGSMPQDSSLVAKLCLIDQHDPIRDFTNAYSTDPVLRRKLADDIRDACINVGFFYSPCINIVSVASWDRG